MSRIKELVSEDVDQFDEPIGPGLVKSQSLTIIGSLAKLNEHDSANRSNRFVGAKLKAEMTEMVMLQCGPLKPITGPVVVSFHWYFSSKHDFDNIGFARKYVLDGMVHSGKLPNDNQSWVHGFGAEYFTKVPKGQEKVVVTIVASDRTL